MPVPLKSPPPDNVTQILEILKRMDRRDRLRTIGGFIRGIFSIIPIVIVIFLTWYTIKYGDQLLEKITTMAAEQAGRVAKQNTITNFMDEFNALNQKLKK
ncbi:MAG TPA: hypothetical protein DEB30_03045 [Candidatus Peribacter riflensis]|uniref:Uncharacterized protein n=1 Tax=Candidatus Peribacter riflensis TaxID=1735162 RepID=A0A0S1SL83_9BACT|nr:MAG: hypothetical protein PeribacterA2_0621 [Candidatus Peribacter riflensis]OGJ78954.1 MAG: hypothetical protein A2398_04580 [Candidatus Peribacteria bacterium RIFOXYB1_FULL_57_12]ALM11095.1 MAG: hypothetical protein PeribacterB2_0621 [Candidatus Peribacter riflensis]ALM12198.1 MAG: hypothetical protein PeribacterC2_0621 [Candidatus Peribacter riflensis]ALM13301.1 MAG: hypothetical protein PeribacterD1_0622 [Candidatus Peribacter riflensis]